MLTRRQLLLSAAAFSMPLAAAVPFEPRRPLRLGLLQSRQPFVDLHDVAGSRERAFTAYRVLIRRSVEEQGPLDWLAGGAFPLSGPGPFTAALTAQLALSEHSAELQWLRSFAKTHRLRLTLGAWWREDGAQVANRLLIFDSRGQCRALPPCAPSVSDSVQLHMPAQLGVPSLSGFAADCGRLNRYGAWIETLRGPATPPGAPALFSCSAIIGPDGNLLAQAGPDESCLVAEVA